MTNVETETHAERKTTAKLRVLKRELMLLSSVMMRFLSIKIHKRYYRSFISSRLSNLRFQQHLPYHQTSKLNVPLTITHSDGTCWSKNDGPPNRPSCRFDDVLEFRMYSLLSLLVFTSTSTRRCQIFYRRQISQSPT